MLRQGFTKDEKKREAAQRRCQAKKKKDIPATEDEAEDNRTKNNHYGQVDGCLDAAGCLDGLFLSKVTQTRTRASVKQTQTKNGISSLGRTW